MAIDDLRNVSHYKRHVTTNQHIPHDYLVCNVCNVRFRLQRLLNSHQCYQTIDSEDFQVYKLIDKNSHEYHFLKRLTISQQFDHCFEKGYAVPGLFPYITTGQRWRRSQLDRYGCTQASASYEKVLQEKHKEGSAGVNAHKTIHIHDSSDRLIRILGSDVTTPIGSKLIVNDIGNNQLFVTLVEGAINDTNDQENVEHQPLLDDVDLTFIHEFAPGDDSGLVHSPHNYPLGMVKLVHYQQNSCCLCVSNNVLVSCSEMRRTRNLFTSCHVMSETDLKYLTGQTSRIFWEWVDMINESPIKSRTLTPPSIALLHR